MADETFSTSQRPSLTSLILAPTFLCCTFFFYYACLIKMSSKLKSISGSFVLNFKNVKHGNLKRMMGANVGAIVRRRLDKE